ncbi:23 kDa integral membrane protein-like [Ostrinia nubilalis]|uniref:23 kDa integral membrane protein-like n=1 Tax=Ostrinia furnacalis TaxID=93504 RepID=UPI00103A6E6F|nr:23 kDa integral membrane protein-like [Ostrinia furnacalis]
MGCGESCVKYILFFTNLFFALAGLVLLGLGIAVQLQLAGVVSIAHLDLSLAPISSMVVGVLVFLIAFFGCCGAIRESNCMLVTFSIFMIILMVLKIALSVVIFVGLDDVVGDVPVWLKQAFAEDRVSFREIETTFQCCGPTGPLSYMNVSLPDSCCAAAPCNILNSYSGCDGIIQEFLRTFGLVIGVVAIVVVSIELVAAVFGLCLANHVRNKYRRRAY